MATTLNCTWRVWVGMAIIYSASVGEKWGVKADQVEHVVGEDRGWEPDTDVASWSSSRTFRIGDKIWFAYSPTHGTIAEVKSEEEYSSCDVSNPIKTYADGLDSIILDGEGIRYFVSSNLKSCKNGLKLPVAVMPKDARDVSTTSVAAAGPATPSDSAHHGASLIVLLVAAFWVSYMFA